MSDLSYVYWTNGGYPGSVMRVPIGGGAVTSLVSGQDGAMAMAVNASTVYWTSGFQVLSLPIGGGTAPSLVYGPNGPPGMIDALAIDATSLYWADLESGDVVKQPLLGGPRPPSPRRSPTPSRSTPHPSTGGTATER